MSETTTLEGLKDAMEGTEAAAPVGCPRLDQAGLRPHQDQWPRP